MAYIYYFRVVIYKCKMLKDWSQIGLFLKVLANYLIFSQKLSTFLVTFCAILKNDKVLNKMYNGHMLAKVPN